MSRVRQLEREDCPQVAALYEQTMRSGGTTPPPRLAPYFERTFLDHPWVDADVPALVYEFDDGRIVGFIGSHVRRLRFDGRPVRMACAGQLVSDPAARRRGVGALLLRHLFAGPQDLTITDGATPEVRVMWEKLGGHTAFLRSLDWTRFFRPWRAVGDRLLERSGRGTWKPAARPLWSLSDALTDRLTGAPLRVDEPPTRAEPLSPSMLVQHLPSVANGHLRVRPDYDEGFAAWLFEEMARVRTRGDLVRCLVREPRGRVLGWYVAYLKPGGVSQVMQVAAADRDMAAVLHHLFHHAQQSGTAALQGRLEPLLFEPLAQWRCLVRYSERALLHSRDHMDIVSAMALGQGMVTRMEGEWWMGHHTEPFA